MGGSNGSYHEIAGTFVFIRCAELLRNVAADEDVLYTVDENSNLHRFYFQLDILKHSTVASEWVTPHAKISYQPARSSLFSVLDRLWAMDHFWFCFFSNRTWNCRYLVVLRS